MKSYYNLLAEIVFCIVLITSYGNQQLRKDMRAFMDSQIVFPNEVVMVKEGRYLSTRITCDKPLLVLFHGKEECSSCVINHLYEDLSGIENVVKTGKCDIVILFSPVQDEMLDIQEQIRDLKFPFPVYVDLYGDFYRLNANFPSDKRFHSFLLGKDGHPKFVGNPFEGESLMLVFEKVLKKIDNDTKYH